MICFLRDARSIAIYDGHNNFTVVLALTAAVSFATRNIRSSIQAFVQIGAKRFSAISASPWPGVSPAAGVLRLPPVMSALEKLDPGLRDPSIGPYRKLEKLDWDNKSIRELPIDLEQENFRRQVRNAIYSRIKPTSLKRPTIVALSDEALIECMSIEPSELRRPELSDFLSGNLIFPGSETYSHCYCGHQFGAFSGQLGDGAAIYLGEIVNHRGERWEVQLKGAGLTPYSRHADGRKVLRSSIREFLCSEAMHYLGVPTTRAGACITSDSMTHRDPFYNGHVIAERPFVSYLTSLALGLAACQVYRRDPPGTLIPASRFLRDLQAHRSDNRSLRLLDYTISTYFPHIHAAHDDSLERYVAFYRQVVLLTARLVAKWQLIGFTHGVLNTDNLSILGLTIDYGPFGFMDHYDPSFIPNGSDGGGRYDFIKQPEICRWNLGKFAEALQMALPLARSTPLLELYDEEYQEAYHRGMREKLGLMTEQVGDPELFKALFETMSSTAADFTQTFRVLMGYNGPADTQKVVESLVHHCAKPSTWAASLTKRMRISKPSMTSAQTQALWALAQSDRGKLGEIFGSDNVEAVVQELRSEVEKLDKVSELGNNIQRFREMKAEDKRAHDQEHWKAFLDNHLGPRLTVDAQSDAADLTIDSRQEMMRNANPSFILRNWVAQEAIAAAEKSDFSRVRRVLTLCKDPYNSPTALAKDEFSDVPVTDDDARFRGPAPDWAAELICTCSS